MTRVGSQRHKKKVSSVMKKACTPYSQSLGFLINCCITRRLQYNTVLWMEMLHFKPKQTKEYSFCIKMLAVFQRL
jgi:hypothetical protein